MRKSQFELRSHTLVLSLDFFLTIIVIACILIGILGESWLTNHPDKIGLWRTCNETDCLSSDNIFAFSTRKDYDIILLFLLMALTAALLSVFNMVCLCCYHYNRKTWRLLALPNIVIQLLAGLACITAMIYSEVSFKSDLLHPYKHGWAFIGGWIGACLCLITFSLAIVIYNCLPKERMTGYSSDSRANYLDRHISAVESYSDLVRTTASVNTNSTSICGNTVTSNGGKSTSPTEQNNSQIVEQLIY